MSPRLASCAPHTDTCPVTSIPPAEQSPDKYRCHPGDIAKVPTFLTTSAPLVRSTNMKATVPVKLDLGRLAAEHYVAVWRYLRLLGCDAALAEDLCQDTFLRVLEKPFDELSAKATAA